MSYRSFARTDSPGFLDFARYAGSELRKALSFSPAMRLQRVGVRLMTANHDCRYGKFQQFFGGGHVDYDTGEAPHPHLGEIIDVQPGLKRIPPIGLGFWRIGLDRQAPELESDRVLPVKIPGYRPLHVTLEVTSLLRAIGVFLHESLHQIRVEIEGLSPASEARVQDPRSLEDETSPDPGSAASAAKTSSRTRDFQRALSSGFMAA